jgi:hypothetical protein
MTKKNLIILLGTMIILLNFMSCSIFEGSRKMDMAPFSDNAGVMFTEAAKIGHTFKWKHLKRYTKIPEFQKTWREAVPILETLKGIVYYSNQVVAINNSDLKDKDKNRQLARYLREVMQRSIEKGKLDSLGMDLETLNQVLNDIPTKKTYLDGIAASSPIINGVVLSMQTRLERLQSSVNNVLNIFDKMIEKDFAMTRINYISLKKLQARSLRSVTYIYDAIMGTPVVPDSLFKLDLSLQKFFKPNEQVTPEQLSAAENYLLDRLNRIDHMITQMDDDIMEYHAKQDEKEDWRIRVDIKIKIIRNAMTVWAQSHRNLGAGIPVPPLIDVASIAAGLAGSAANAVIP